MPAEAAEGLAIQALSFIAQDGERLGRFLAITGIGPHEIRAAAGIAPAEIDRARAALGGKDWERELP